MKELTIEDVQALRDAAIFVKEVASQNQKDNRKLFENLSSLMLELNMLEGHIKVEMKEKAKTEKRKKELTPDNYLAFDQDSLNVVINDLESTEKVLITSSHKIDPGNYKFILFYQLPEHLPYDIHLEVQKKGKLSFIFDRSNNSLTTMGGQKIPFGGKLVKSGSYLQFYQKGPKYQLNI